MSSLSVSLVGLAAMAGGAGVGVILRRFLPGHHLRDDSKEVLKTVAGMLATLIALVIGLLVSAAKDTFDAAGAAVTGGGAKIIMVDRLLKRFGPRPRAPAIGSARPWPPGSSGSRRPNTAPNRP